MTRSIVHWLALGFCEHELKYHTEYRYPACAAIGIFDAAHFGASVDSKHQSIITSIHTNSKER
jgi:hypothetical protein